VYERVLSSTSSPSRIGSVRSERARWVPPNNTFDRTAGSHSLAAAGQRARCADTHGLRHACCRRIEAAALVRRVLGPLARPITRLEPTRAPASPLACAHGSTAAPFGVADIAICDTMVACNSEQVTLGKNVLEQNLGNSNACPLTKTNQNDEGRNNEFLERRDLRVLWRIYRGKARDATS
jgi:hypothetical protein